MKSNRVKPASLCYYPKRVTLDEQDCKLTMGDLQLNFLQQILESCQNRKGQKPLPIWQTTIYGWL